MIFMVMVLYLAVNMWLLSVPLGFGRRHVFVIHLTRFGVNMDFLIHSQFLLSTGSPSCDKCFEFHFATFSCKEVFLVDVKKILMTKPKPYIKPMLNPRIKPNRNTQTLVLKWSSNITFTNLCIQYIRTLTILQIQIKC